MLPPFLIVKVLHQTAKESLSDERYGTLTQRLMSCLLEENGIVPPGEEMPFVVAQGRTTSAPNAASIEQRIRRELEELGVMQALAEKVTDRERSWMNSMLKFRVSSRANWVEMIVENEQEPQPRIIIIINKGWHLMYIENQVFAKNSLL